MRFCWFSSDVGVCECVRMLGSGFAFRCLRNRWAQSRIYCILPEWHAFLWEFFLPRSTHICRYEWGETKKRSLFSLHPVASVCCDASRKNERPHFDRLCFCLCTLLAGAFYLCRSKNIKWKSNTTKRVAANNANDIRMREPTKKRHSIHRAVRMGAKNVEFGREMRMRRPKWSIGWYVRVRVRAIDVYYISYAGKTISLSAGTRESRSRSMRCKGDRQKSQRSIYFFCAFLLCYAFFYRIKWSGMRTHRYTI